MTFKDIKYWYNLNEYPDQKTANVIYNTLPQIKYTLIADVADFYLVDGCAVTSKRKIDFLVNRREYDAVDIGLLVKVFS